jgi:hypothetical protein
VFANTGWHSPALWPNSLEVANLYANNYKDIKIFYNVGAYEDLGVDWSWFESSLQAQGYEYANDEKYEGHSWGSGVLPSTIFLNTFFLQEVHLYQHMHL